MNKLIMLVAMLPLVAAVGGFYYYEDQSLLYRVIGLLVAVGISVAIAMQSSTGRQAWAFVGDSRGELRKVVWPARKETMQTTLMVMVMVFIVAVILWLFDTGLSWAVQQLTGQGG